METKWVILQIIYPKFQKNFETQKLFFESQKLYGEFEKIIRQVSKITLRVSKIVLRESKLFASLKIVLQVLKLE